MRLPAKTANWQDVNSKWLLNVLCIDSTLIPNMLAQFAESHVPSGWYRQQDAYCESAKTTCIFGPVTDEKEGNDFSKFTFFAVFLGGQQPKTTRKRVQLISHST